MGIQDCSSGRAVHVRGSVGNQVLSVAPLLAAYAESQAESDRKGRRHLRRRNVSDHGSTLFCGLVQTILPILGGPDG